MSKFFLHTFSLVSVGLLVLGATPLWAAEPSPESDRPALAPASPADLWVTKNLNGSAAPGGRADYRIQFGTNNNAATNVFITDTLPAGVTFVANSAYTATVLGNQVIFDLGTVPAWMGWNEFAVIVEVADTFNPGDHLTNTVEIAADLPDLNPGDNTAFHDVELIANDTDVQVWKDPRTGDPAAGEHLIWQIGYQNSGAAGSGVVRITDTLPLSTSVVSWWADEPGWTVVYSTATQIAWERPMIPGYSGNWLYLATALDPALAYNTQLWNHVEIATPYDADLLNNTHDRDVWTNHPHWNACLGLSFDNGSTTPGGQINYGLNYQNCGNAATHNTQLTFTLPANVTVLQIGAWGPNGWVPMPPDAQVGDTLIWQLGTLMAGQQDYFQVQVLVNANAPIGAPLIASSGLTMDESDDNPSNNFAQLTDAVFPPGPNLHVVKQLQWVNNGQAEYAIRLDNRGDAPVSSFWFTDTYPLSTTLANQWRQWGHHLHITDTQNADSLVWWIEELSGGDTVGFGMQLNLDGGQVQRLQWYTNTAELMPIATDTNPADNSSAVGFFWGEVDNAEFWVGTENSGAWGSGVPGNVRIITPFTEVTDSTDPNGNWNFGDIGPLHAGDVVTVEQGAGTLPVVFTIPAPFTVAADSTTNQVFGEVGDLNGALLQVDLYGGYASRTTHTAPDGTFSVTFPDVPRGGNGEVRYDFTAQFATVRLHQAFAAPDLLLHINVRDNWVEGNYAPGHTIWLTVTDELGAVKGLATLHSQVIPWWGGQTGFSTNFEGWLGQPDFAPGDWVSAAASNGYTSTARVGDLTGLVTLATNSVTGTLTAAWFADPLSARCEVWGPNPPTLYVTVDPHGGSYACSWDGVYTLQQGDYVAVSYIEPDGDRLTFSPTPDLSVSKWANGQPAAGSNFGYWLNYANHGSVPAENVLLVETLPAGLTYLGDTSGFTPVLAGNQVIWNLGLMVPGINRPFMLFVAVDSGLSNGTPLENTLDVTTDSLDSNNGNNHASDPRTVEANSANLTLGQNPRPGNPTAGDTMLWEIGYHNQGNTASGVARITDTLPLSTTFVGWRADEPGWALVYSDTTQLVWERPTINGNSGNWLYLTLALDPALTPGTELSNTVSIDNNAQTQSAWVDDPHPNLCLNLNFNSGLLVAGGQVSYNLRADNCGNVTMPNTLVTLTLPAHTTFVQAGYSANTEWVNFPPTTQAGQTLVWDLGTFAPGQWQQWDVQIRLALDAPVGALLHTTAELGSSAVDEDPSNNVATWAEQVYAYGPNLRVRHWQWWNGPGQIQYQVQFENIGTTIANDVWLTDTLPTFATWNGWWSFGFDWGRLLGTEFNPTTMAWHFSTLNPGDAGNVQFQLDLDDPNARPRGYTSTATITLPLGDVNPPDNVAESSIFLDEAISGLNVATSSPPPTPALVGTPVYFTATLATGSRVTFAWDFGDGQTLTSTTLNATHTYATAGAYTVTLIATNTENQESATAFVLINDLPQAVPDAYSLLEGAALNISAPGVLGNDPNTVGTLTAELLSPPAVGGLSLSPNGGFTYLPPTEFFGIVTFTYRAHDDWTVSSAALVTLTVTNVNDAPVLGAIGNRTVDEGVALAFTATANDLDNDTLAFTLDAGAPTGAAINSTSGAFTWTPTEAQGPGVYPLTLRVTDNGTPPLADFETFTVTVNDVNLAPSANDDFAATLEATPVTVAVLANDSDPDGTITLTVTALTAPSNGTAATNGTTVTYTPTLGFGGIEVFTYTVSDGALTDTARIFVTVTAQTLVANFDYAPQPGHLTVGGTARFTDTSTTAGPAILAWAWTFGDGQTATAQHPTHSYPAAGTYTVTLTITDALGYTASRTRAASLIVADVNLTVTASAEASVTFTNARGLTTTLTVPAGAVTQTMVLAFTEQTTTTTPTGWQFAGRTFTLDAYHNGVLVPGFQLNGPMTITLSYAPSDVVGLNLNTLALHYWTGTTWQDAACGPYVSDSATYKLTAQVCHFSHFSLFGQTVRPLYLPFIRR